MPRPLRASARCVARSETCSCIPGPGPASAVTLVGRTICNNCPPIMLTSTTLNRHTNRPNRHINRHNTPPGDLLRGGRVGAHPTRTDSARSDARATLEVETKGPRYSNTNGSPSAKSADAMMTRPTPSTRLLRSRGEVQMRLSERGPSRSRLTQARRSSSRSASRSYLCGPRILHMALQSQLRRKR